MRNSNGAHAGQPVEVVLKADEILELLREHGDLTVARIAEGVEEPRSSVYRLLATLEEMDFVEPDPRGNGYRLGLGLFRLGKLVASQLPIIPAARPAMERLFDRTGETIFLLVRHGTDALCVERLDGRRVQSMAVAVGGTLPLHLGAGPMVLLAHSDEATVDAYLRTGDLVGRTARSVTHADAIRARLSEIREHGHAVSDEDLVPGLAALGAPVRDAAGSVVAALSMSGARASLLEASAAANIELVREAATSIVAPSV